MTSVLDITNLQFKYPDGKAALHGIDLQIQEGESVGLIGPNGAGKTTLLLHLNGILRGSGELTVMGMRVEKANLKVIRSRLGLVFQNPDDQLFSATVFDDVAFGPLNMGLSVDEVTTYTLEALSQVGMEGFESRSPHHLSLGEKKRVAIATVLSMRPEILVLDEPTSNLDPCQRRNLIELLKNLAVTSIIASHDLEMIYQLCDRVIVLNGGRIVRDGIVDEILFDNALMDASGLEALSYGAISRAV